MIPDATIADAATAPVAVVRTAPAGGRVLPLFPLRAALVAVFLLGIYANYSILLFDGRLYGVISYLAAIPLAFLNFHRLMKFGRMLFFVASVVLLGGILSPDGHMFMPRILRSTVLFMGCVTAATIVVIEVARWPAPVVRQAAMAICVAIIGLAALESFTDFRVLSDAFRNAVYDGDDVFNYTADDRDEQYYAKVRPKVFTQEPSNPAKMVLVASCAWLMLSRSRHRVAVFGLFIAVAYLLIRSPSLMGALVLLPACLSTRGSPKRRRQANVAALVMALAVMLLPLWVGILPSERARDIASGDDASAVMRTIAPLYITGQILVESPLFGIGIGGVDNASDTVYDTYSQFGSIHMSMFEMSRSAGWNNGFFQLICFLGIVGLILFYVWLKRFSRSVTVDVAFVVLAFFVMFFVDGAVNILRPWGYFGLLVAVRVLELRVAAAPSSRTSRDPAGMKTRPI